MSDITPELINKVNRAFENNCNKDKNLLAAEKKLKEKTATYQDAYSYAESIGTARAKAFKSEISSQVLPDGKMYFNIADSLMNDSLSTDHEMAAEYAKKVQQIANEKANIKLKAQKADLNQDRIDGFVNRLSSEDSYDDIKWLLDEPVKVHALSVVDDTIKKNATFQGKAGIKATVIRDAKADCCQWCNDLAGDYVYPKVPREVFARHDNCRCTLDYEGRRLSAYTSAGGKTNTFRDLGEQDKIEARKQLSDASIINSSTRFKTGDLDPSEYALGKQLWNRYAEQNIPYQRGKEALFEEFDNNLSPEEKKSCIIHKAVDDYKYTAVHLGHNQYKVIRVEQIENTFEKEMMDLFGDEYGKYFK